MSSLWMDKLCLLSLSQVRSLHQFMGEKNLPVAIRFDASVPSSQQIQTTMMKNGESTPVDYRLLIFAIVPSSPSTR